MHTAMCIVVGFLAIVGLLSILIAGVFFLQSDIEQND